MPKSYALRLVIRVLESKGFVFISQSGSHAKYRKINGETLTVIVPIHGKDVLYGTFRSVLRQANLAEDDFARK